MRNKLIRFLKENASKKKLIIINDYDKADLLAKAIRCSLHYFGSNTTILCFNSRKPEEFSDFANKITISEDYLTHEDYLAIDRHIFNFVSKKWDNEAKIEFRDIFIYHGVELPRISEYDFQLFLVSKIKAVTVIDKAIKKENYEALFIADSNNELNNFEKLLRQNYSIPAVYFRVKEKYALQALIKRKISSVISCLVDKIAGVLSRRKKGARLIDAQLFYQLEINNSEDFILVLCEKGLKIRLRCLFKNGGYISFTLPPEDTEKKWFYPKVLRKFDIHKLADQFIFQGIPYWKVVENKTKTVVYSNFVDFRKNINILTNLRKSYNIKAVVFRNDVKALEKTIVLSAKKLNIPTLIVQHGIMTNPNGHETLFADKIAVWGRHAVDWYRKSGNDSKKMIITGSHVVDNKSHSMNKDEKKYLSDKLNIKKKRYIITFFTTSGGGKGRFSAFENHDISFNLIRDMIKAARSIRDVNLIIKLHPNENLKTFAKLLSEEDRATMAIKDRINPTDLIEISDLVVIGGASTLGLKAVIMKKPLVVINLDKKPDLIPYVENNVAIGAYKTEDIESVIKKGLSDDGIKSKMDSARRDFINDFAYKTDGSARDRILNVIENL